MRLNSTLLIPFEAKAEHKLFPLPLSLFLLIISRLRYHRDSYQYEFLERIEMWVYSISPPSLSLIGPLTREIYYWTNF